MCTAFSTNPILPCSTRVSKFTSYKVEKYKRSGSFPKHQEFCWYTEFLKHSIYSMLMILRKKHLFFCRHCRTAVLPPPLKCMHSGILHFWFPEQNLYFTQFQFMNFHTLYLFGKQMCKLFLQILKVEPRAFQKRITCYI